MRDQQDHSKNVFKAVAFAIVILVILWARRPDSLLNAQFWAEDGGVFFREQTMFGFWGSVTRPYSGYIHLVPRIVTAVISSSLPVRWVPLGFNVITLVIEAICCSAFFWPCYRRIIESDAIRAVCCLLIASTTVTGSEVIGTLSNVQWYLCILSLLLLMAKAHSVRGELSLTIVQVLIAFTAPVTLLYAPFLAVQCKQNIRALKFRPAVHLLALCAQALVLRSGMFAAKPPLRFDSLFVATLGSGLTRCIIAPLVGWRFSRDCSDVGLFAALGVALVVTVALATFLTVNLYRTERLKWIWCAIYLAVGSLLAILWGRALVTPFLTIQGLRDYAAERYFLFGSCLFVFCLAITIDRFTKPRHWHLAAAVLAAIFAYGTARNFSARPFVDLNWNENAAKIEQWQAAQKRHEHVGQLAIPINPPNMNMILD